MLIKDVEGVYSSDPDKVRNPQFIESLNGEEAEMLAGRRGEVPPREGAPVPGERAQDQGDEPRQARTRGP